MIRCKGQKVFFVDIVLIVSKLYKIKLWDSYENTVS